MCDPVSIALGGVALGTKVAGDIAGNKAAKKAREAEILAANASFRNQIADLTARKREEAAAASLDVQQIRDMSLVEQGLAQASAADSNVAGASVDAATSTLQRKGQLSTDVAFANLDAILAQLDRSAVAANADRASRINGAPQPKSFGATALDTLGFAAQMALPYIKRGG